VTRSQEVARAYAAALSQLVEPGGTVLDLGEESGLRAIVACRLGARRVFALHPAHRRDMIRRAAAANGCGGQIECIDTPAVLNGRWNEVTLVVGRVPSVGPLFGSSLLEFRQAADRVIPSTTAWIPRRETLWMGVVEAGDCFSLHADAWEPRDRGFDLSACRLVALNRWSDASIDPEHLLTDPCRWAHVNYAEPSGGRVGGQADYVVRRPGTGHGVAIWSDVEFADGIALDNAPGRSPSRSVSAFFPWPEPQPLREGDMVHVNMRADFLGGPATWTWHSRIARARTDVDVAFTQSTFMTDFDLVAAVRAKAEKLTI
jgi:hypothetical protein